MPIVRTKFINADLSITVFTNITERYQREVFCKRILSQYKKTMKKKKCISLIKIAIKINRIIIIFQKLY